MRSKAGLPTVRDAHRAAVLVGPSVVAVNERPVGEAGPGDAVVRVQASGICGTDVAIYRGDTHVDAGRVLGHEGAGIVTHAPHGSRLEAGQPVVIDPTIACGYCALCLEGRPNLCPNGGLLGREIDGVFADEVVVPAANLHPLPAGLALADAPLLQVLATVVRAQELVHVVPGRTAAVVGLGCTGQLHAQILAHRGARVLGVNRTPEKRTLAAELSCEWTASLEEAHELGPTLGPLGGADLVVECAGRVDTLDLALELVRPGGTVLCYGTITDPGSLNLYSVYKKELTLVGTRASLPRDMEIAIGLAATGAVQLAPIVSDRLSLDAVSEALERSARGALKVLMEHA